MRDQSPVGWSWLCAPRYFSEGHLWRELTHWVPLEVWIWVPYWCFDPYRADPKEPLWQPGSSPSASVCARAEQLRRPTEAIACRAGGDAS